MVSSTEEHRAGFARNPMAGVYEEDHLKSRPNVLFWAAIFTPKALRSLAQGCRAAATLGQEPTMIPYPNGVVQWRIQRTHSDSLRNPFGVEQCERHLTQGSRSAATLG